MNFQKIWKNSKKMLALLLAITLFFGGWGNYDFSVFASGELTVSLSDDSEIYTGSAISLPGITSVKNGDVDVASYTSIWTDSEGNEVSGTVTNAGTYTLTVKETATETVTDPDTGEEKEETTETGLDGAATFTVEKLDLAVCTVTADTVTYKGTAFQPANVVVKNSAGAEVSKALYSVTNVTNNTEAGTAEFRITAADANNTNVTGTKAGTFTINAIDLAACTVSAETVTYTGTELKPAVTVQLGDAAVDSNFYQVEYSDNINAGTGKFTVKPADGNSSVINEKAGTFTINAKALTADMLAISPEKETVNGESFTSKVEVTVKDTVNGTEAELVKDTDYTVEIPDSMIEGDSYTIKVSGKGNYAGTVETSFTLEYATDGTAALEGSTLAEFVYADSVKVKAADGYLISESVTGTYSDSITYTADPADYIVYIKNQTTGKVTEYNLEAVYGAIAVDTDVPGVSVVSAPAADSDWAVSKDIVLDVTGADYGVYYTTTKVDLGSVITTVPDGMTKLDENTLTIAENISAETTYYFYAIDYAGHVATTEATVNKVDTTVPTLQLSGNDEKIDGDFYWKNADDLVFTVKAEDQTDLSGLKEIVVEGTATDGLSCAFTEGAASAEGTFTIKEAGTYTLKSVDVAGNESDVITIEVKEDTLAPEVVLADPTGTNFYLDETNDVYWFSAEAVKLPFTVTDETGTDETEKAPYTVVYATDENFTDAKEASANAATVAVTLVAGNEGKTTYYFKSTDKAGNTGEPQAVTVGYDNTQPEITEAVLTQLNGDEWINLTESGASQPNETKVAFSVTTADAESGVQKIQYRSNSNEAWQDAVCTESNGTYTFVTNEAYADGVDYVWEVRVANNVTVDMENATTASVADGKIDTTAPSTTAYIRFISDTTGANDVNRGTVTDDKWSSNIYEMATNAWNKIWGKETVKFEVYVQDVTSGIDSIAMSYNGDEITGLTKVDGVQAFTTGDGEDKEGYIVYEGTITYKESAGLAVQNFQIDSLTDVAGNISDKVVLGNAADTDIIYIDNVAPKLVSAQIDGENVVTDNAYIYDTAKDLVLTVEERFFAQENTPVYPTVVLESRESGVSDFAPVDNANITWTESGEGTISLPLVDGKEIEYQVTMTYNDPSGNSLATDGNLGVENGTFTSKIFVIDAVAPEFVSYSVAGTGCYVEDASVLENNTENDDLVVEFTIDDNPTYYAKTTNHAYAQENLIVKLYKEGELVKTLQDGVDGVEVLAKTVDGRNHTYSFSYDGEVDTQDKFYVTVEYKDVVNHLMVDAADTVTPGTVENGVYTSEEYIIDHVAPVFDITYSAATNVVKDGVSNGTAPLAEHMAYYNTNIDVTLTFDEKYFNAPDNDALEHFEIVLKKDGGEIAAPSITWTHEENVHTAKFTIEALADHSNDGDYQFEVNYFDCAVNAMTTNNVDAQTLLADGKYTSPVLVMDTTAPVVTTSYSATAAQTLEERDYFNADTTFNIEVSDRSIRYQELKAVLETMTAVDVDGDAIADTQLAADIDAVVDTDVQHTMGNEDPAVWTLPLTLSTEANYDIPVRYTDLAGNTAIVQFKAQDSTITDCGTEYTEKVTVDKQILEDNIFIKFTGDIKGENVINQKMLGDTTEEGNWISKIYRFISNVWMKLWGNKEIKFDVYLRDEISGIQAITMQYLDDEENAVPCTLTKGTDVKLSVDADGVASIDDSGEVYVVYSGSIVIDDDTDLAVSQFEIIEATDKATNALNKVLFTSAGDAEILHLDDVAPKLVGVTFNEKTAVDEKVYYNNEKTDVVLTIEERFFGKENDARYPAYKLIAFNATTNERTEKDVTTTEDDWNDLGNDKYKLTIPLDIVEASEVEYRIVLSYDDAAGNLLVNGNGINGVVDGTFTSKIFVIDAVAPVLSSVLIDNKMVDSDSMYFYDDTKSVEITIDERYFGKETNPVIPSYILTTKCILDDGSQIMQSTNPPVETSIANANTAEDAKNVWRQVNGTNKYTLTVDLPLQSEMEMEYIIEFTYSDASGNDIVNVNEEYTSIVDGTFTSKTFVIDDITPELVDYSVVTTACDVQGASVLENVTSEDLVVNFTINDNPTYYARTDKHEYSQENLIVKLYKEGELIKTLQDGVTGSDQLTKSVDGRNHSYSFVYDGEVNTQDKFQVTVEYADVVNHLMLDEEDTVTPGTMVPGKYTSEEYIIDHVAPVFGITYSDATNVVEGTRNHDASKTVSDEKSPLTGYTAYYNKDITVTFTFDEKYVNVVDEQNNKVDCDNDSTNPLDHFTFEIQKNGTVLTGDAIPEINWSHNGTVHTATFTIKALTDHTNDGDYQFVVTYQDCATNKMVATNDSNESAKETGEYKSPILVMDTTAPVLTKVSYDTISKFNTVKARDYVNAPTTMTFTMTEHNPTPTSGYSIKTEGAKTATWSISGDTSTTTLETVPMRNAKGDEQTISMYIEDWAGNKVVPANDNVRRSKTNTTLSNGTFTDKFTVDTVAPEIELEYVTYTPDRPNVEGIDYFKQPITVKVTVDEHNFDEDLFKQPVVKTDKDVAYKESGWSTSGDKHVKTFTFSKDNQYDLSIIGTDNAKNKLKLNDAPDMAEKLDTTNSKVSVSVAVDSTIPAIGDKVKPIIVIKPATPQNETIDGQALYNTDVTYEVVVYDPLLNEYASGINDITFKVTGEDGTAATCEVNKQGSISNGSGVTVKRVGGDVAELARGVDNKYTFNVTISSATFNTNGIVLWVGANDVATTHNEKEVEPIAIDITEPKVVVSYDNNDVSNEKYFHDVRTATVTVTERNFSDDCLKFIVNGGDRELNFSLSSAGSGNRDNAVWVAHYTFGPDQDYTVDVEVQDRAKNAGTVDYVGEAPQEFTIDMKKPKISVDYDNNNVLNEFYYKEARTATITIEEHNFDADDVIIELTANDGGRSINTPGVSSWVSDGDYHRAIIHYNYDGEFTFDIEFMDLATNEADDYEMDHFIVDLTAPELEIFDIEHMSANKGIVRPGVRYSDTNYDADGTVVVMTGYNNGVVEMTGTRNITATGVEFKLDDFEYVQSMDDLYTMHATVYDLAGNSSEATVMFSVNRFGSVYTFDENTDALVGDNGKYYTNKEQQLVITETNVDTLEFKEITLNLNGKLVTLKEGVDFTVSLNGNESTWKQYTYKINAENFVEEGTYILTIYSEDRATNTSDNSSKGKKIEFVVDKTNPSLLVSGIENAGQYRTSNKEMIIDVEDNVRLSKVVVIVDGVEIATFDAAQIDEVNGRLAVAIKDASDWQVVEVVAYDAAGNVQSHEKMSVLVSANILVQWYRNTPVFYGSLAGFATLAGLLWWFLIGKKKKKEDEEEQVK